MDRKRGREREGRRETHIEREATRERWGEGGEATRETQQESNKKERGNE